MLRPLALVSIVVTLSSAAAPAAEGKRYAVVIGVQKYDAALTPPEFAERDATELTGPLKTAGYDVTLLTDAGGRTDKALTPTKANIERALKTALDKCKRDDLVLVAFAGHGARGAGSAGYLCPTDGKPLPDGKDSLISVESVCTDLAASEVGEAVLLVDACRTPPADDRPAGVDGTGLKVPPRVFALFSCSPGERAVEHKDIRHGAFFDQVIAGLNGSAADGNDAITFTALAAHLRAEVPKRAAKLAAGAKQTPVAVAPEGAKVSPVLARHPATVPAAEWDEYWNTWSVGSTRPFLEKHAPKRFAAWRKAAEAGSARGMMLLADCSEFGVGTPKDPKAAAEWYRRSSERGNSFAMVGLGGCYQRGFGVEKDEKEAARWFRKGADLGDPGCMEFLGSCYLRGRGVEKDEKEAVNWYRKSAATGFGQSFESLGACYLDGKGVEKDEKEAVNWFRKGYEWGSADGAVLLGFCYQTGNGVEEDEKEAAAWYRKGADLGSAFAMNRLARCYLDGTGVDEDEKLAAEWLRKAADLDHVDSMLGLGVLYMKGIGVPKDRAEAARWLRKAAALGSAEAKELLKSFAD